MSRVPIIGNVVAPPAPDPETQERVVEEMWERDIIKPYEKPLPDAAGMETGVGYTGIAFTIHDEFDRELVALLPPRTYVFANADRFNADVFALLADILKSEEGRRLVEARGWSTYIPG